MRVAAKLISAALVSGLVGLSTMVLVLAPAASATFRGRNGALLWTSNVSPGLWLSADNGKQARKISSRGDPCGLYTGALFTRSGTEILFPASSQCGNAPVQILLLKLNGAVQKQVATVSLIGNFEGSFALSPDGRQLAYGADAAVGGPGQGIVHRVLIIDLRTGRTTQSTTLPQGPTVIGPLTWSARGQLFYTVQATDSVEVSRPNGSHQRTVPIRLPDPGLGPSVQEVVASPDGSQLALGVVDNYVNCGNVGSPSCQNNLYVVNSGGGVARRLTHSGQADSPVWSPDGSQIAFHDGYGTAIVTVRTGHVRKLVKNRIRGVPTVVDWQALP